MSRGAARIAVSGGWRGAAAALLLAAAPGLALAQATVEVKMEDYKFIPAEVKIKRGTTVKWTNTERRTSHSVVFIVEKFESDRLFPGESYQRKFDKPGTYAYTCGPHPEMKAVIIVTE
ncbi:MAG: plastocyanin [Betaproteobacteria bacterium]|nr:plastocyanin [Betaproteobacteria bacterium]